MPTSTLEKNRTSYGVSKRFKKSRGKVYAYRDRATARRSYRAVWITIAAAFALGALLVLKDLFLGL